MRNFWKHVFMGKIPQEKGTNRRKYITTFNFLNLGLIANVEKIILKTDFLKLNLRLSIFAFYRT